MSRRALFLDRDGVINVDHGYVHTPEQTAWIPGIFDLCRRARAAGLELVVITNQAGIARAYYDEAQFHRYMDWVKEKFQAEGCPLSAVYFCPHHPREGVGSLRTDCDCRKPAPGMILKAERDLSLDLPGSWLLGDKEGDVEAGLAAGVGHNCLFLSPLYPPSDALLRHPGVTVVHDLQELTGFQ